MGHRTDKDPQPLPPAVVAGTTLVIMFVVVSMVWRNTLHRPDIRGNWSSTSCEKLESPTGDKASRLQRMQLTGGQWTLEQTYFSDIDCQNKAYSLQTVGIYELGNKSPEVDGAVHGEFIRKEIHLTAFSMDTAQVFEQYQCGNTKWETDVTTMINATGCTGITPSISSCPAEYNLVKRDEDTLYFGDRSESLCEHNEWPNKLEVSGLKKES